VVIAVFSRIMIPPRLYLHLFLGERDVWISFFFYAKKKSRFSLHLFLGERDVWISSSLFSLLHLFLGERDVWIREREVWCLKGLRLFW
jgi:hypothetical protein